MKKKILTCLLFMLGFVLFSQSYKHISIENGLPSNRVYKVIEDKEGFIWIATDKGIAKYDGDYFKVFNIKNGLPSNDIWEMFLTIDQRIWFFTRSNKLGYIQNDQVFSYPIEDNESVYPIFIATDRNQLIFHSYDKNYILKNNEWKTFSLKDGNNIKIFSDNVNYFKTQTLEDKRKQKAQLYDYNNQVIFELEKEKGFKVLNQQINDSLLVFNLHHGLLFYNLKTQKSYQSVYNDLFEYSGFVRVLSTDTEIQISGKNFWTLLDKNYQLKDVFKFPSHLKIRTAYKDRKGNIWGISYANGIYLFSKNSLHTKKYLKGEIVQFQKKIKNNLFIGIMNEGIYRYNIKKDSFEMFFPAKDYFFDIVYKDDKNFAVFGSNSTYLQTQKLYGEFYHEGKNCIFYQQGYATIKVKGVQVYDENFTPIRFFEINTPNVILNYKNNILVGTPAGLKLISDDIIKDINFKDNFTYPVISLAKIGKQIIVGTDGYGAYIWDGNKNMELIPETKDLIINNIFVENYDFWLASQKGVLDYQYQPKIKLKKLLRKTDGLVSDHVNHVVVFNDKIFTSNLNSIASIDKNQEEIFPIQKIYLKSILYNDIQSDTLINELLFKKESNLLFNYGIIDYSGQEHNRYFYRLLPIQKEWVEIRSKSVNFINLDPRKYSFQIKVKNPYRQELTKTYDFNILPLWWQKDISKLLFVFLFLSIIFLIGYLTRKKELKKQEEKLLAQKQMAEFELYALRSQMNPHFVFNSLNSILYYINDENYDKSESYLIRFSRLIRMIFEFSRKKNISLNQEIKLLKSYLELEKMRFGEKLNYCFEIDPELDLERTLIPTLLLQPTLENAVNHGIFHKNGRGTVCLEFKKINKNSYQVVIKDDGIGLKKSKELNQKSLKKHVSRSTQILLERIKLLNLSGKWKITYEVKDVTLSDSSYNTIVTLKITNL